jgi:protein-S-isoprenylcysteine O-methyltransferase Ste14
LQLRRCNRGDRAVLFEPLGRAPMKCGELQSVIQLSVALNAIYVGLRDISNPHVRREDQALVDQAETWKKTRGPAEIGAAINDNKVLLTTKLYSFRRLDFHVGRSCLTFIIVYVVLLVLTSFYYEDTLNKYVAILIAVAGFLPITVAFVLHSWLVRDLRATVGVNREKIERQLVKAVAREVL